MADDTFTPSLHVRLIAQGNYPNAYADPLNEDALTPFDAAIAGRLDIDIGSDTEYLLEDLQEGTLSETHYHWLRFTGTPASEVTVIVPGSVDISKDYLVENLTGQILNFKYASTDGVRLADDQASWVQCDGASVRPYQMGYEITDEEVDEDVTVVDPGYRPGETSRYGDDQTAIDSALAIAALGVLPPHLFGNQILLGKILSPSTISGNVNNYAPAGIDTCNVLRISTDASRNITGIAMGPNPRVLPVFNVGGFDAVLKNNDSGSSDANKFAIGADVTLGANESALLFYDSVSERIRILGRHT